MWCRFEIAAMLIPEVFPEAAVNAGKLLFAQLMDFLPWTSFARSVARYGGDRRVRSLACEQFRAMAFAQLTYRESLRDIRAARRTRGSRRAVVQGSGRSGRDARIDRNSRDLPHRVSFSIAKPRNRMLAHVSSRDTSQQEPSFCGSE